PVPGAKGLFLFQSIFAEGISSILRGGVRPCAFAAQHRNLVIMQGGFGLRLCRIPMQNLPKLPAWDRPCESIPSRAATFAGLTLVRLKGPTPPKAPFDRS